MNEYKKRGENVPSLRTGGRYCQVGTTVQTSPELPMVLTALSLGEKRLRVRACAHTHMHTQSTMKQNQKRKAEEF